MLLRCLLLLVSFIGDDWIKTEGGRGQSKLSRRGNVGQCRGICIALLMAIVVMSQLPSSGSREDINTVLQKDLRESTCSRRFYVSILIFNMSSANGYILILSRVRAGAGPNLKQLPRRSLGSPLEMLKFDRTHTFDTDCLNTHCPRVLD